MSNLHPEGVFVATPIFYEVGESNQKGTEYIAVTFKVDDTGQQVQAWLYLTDNTWKRTAEALRACGWSGTDFADFTKNKAPGFGAAKVKITIEQEEYNGKVRAKVKWVNALTTVASASAFGSKFKDGLAALDKPAAVGTGQMSIEDVLNEVEDSVPF